MEICSVCKNNILVFVYVKGSAVCAYCFPAEEDKPKVGTVKFIANKPILNKKYIAKILKWDVEKKKGIVESSWGTYFLLTEKNIIKFLENKHCIAILNIKE